MDNRRDLSNPSNSKAIFDTPSLEGRLEDGRYPDYVKGGKFKAKYTPAVGDVITWKCARHNISNTTRELGSMRVGADKSTEFEVTGTELTLLKNVGTGWVFQYVVRRGTTEMGYSYLLLVNLGNAL